MGRAGGALAGPDAVKPRYPYPRAAVERFVDACATAAGQRPACVCTIERLQRTLPFREFAAADAAIRADRPVAPGTQRIVDAATTACRDGS